MANEKPKALSTEQQKPELDLSVMKQEATNADKLESIRQTEPPERIQPVFKTLHPGAKIPMIQTENSAGADIHSLSKVRIEAGRSAVINTGIALDHKLPKGICIIMEMRSGLRFSKNLTQLGIGIIDFCENHGVGLEYYVGWLRDRGYSGGEQILPHGVE